MQKVNLNLFWLGYHSFFFFLKNSLRMFVYTLLCEKTLLNASDAVCGVVRTDAVLIHLGMDGFGGMDCFHAP